ncbi:hypothetical protein BAUCODRAFT_29329 [Baudoinia panamericana UAMH 10762]|uniref:proline--tRNA ligase n=1 Tax=Baudoinia panamericana (strain UAMH 10762) TaxID=717646 RepID=M2M1M2_BAUPA|nr:uncharacterized protein BAUCODRAFT_29329 [Baudoinia panamericana UAMH 10762]EMD00953.1 hypothetical protein BAUCODRAFT_29329 [Baudoinia panamericana UAMH 10762]
MVYCYGLKRCLGTGRSTASVVSLPTRRSLHRDGRHRLSNFWAPTQQKASTKTAREDGHDLLVRAGFLRQAQSGIFHLLPLGLRVQDKIERLIDKHMLSLGASKVSLSTFSSEELWRRSGRLDKGRGSELFSLEDRKGTKLLLSPTHEEEITNIVANAVHSHKQLPLRLYQVSRKYRDEARPRQGLLRGREFLMKDLYTFDSTDDNARCTYEEVRRAYCAFLDDLRLPYVVANADSGNMGGSLSHEYHFVSEKGEDTVITCNQCDFSVNEELFVGRPEKVASAAQASIETQLAFFVSKDRKTLLNVIYPAGSDVNIYAVKAVFPDVDASVEDAASVWKRTEGARDIVIVFDPRITNPRKTATMMEKRGDWRTLGPVNVEARLLEPLVGGEMILLTQAREGDNCPRCESGSLKLHSAVEIGHTFHLGTRYSEPLALTVTDQNNQQRHVSMGCHGIGVSRLVGAAASLLADEKGLNWPLAIAPFSAIIVTASAGTEDADKVHDLLEHVGVDAVVDDREQKVGWKLNDADLVGYPFIVVLGKAWADRQAIELQCRRLGFKEAIDLGDLAAKVQELSQRL